MNRIAGMVCSLAMLCGFAYGQGTAEAEVKAAENAWIKAVTAKDMKGLESILAPRLVYTHSTGLIENKQEYMKAVNSFQLYKAIDLQDVRVNVYDDAAIVNAKARMQGSTKGTPFDNMLLIIHVWVKQGGKWQLAAHQTTRLNP